MRKHSFQVTLSPRFYKCTCGVTLATGEAAVRHYISKNPKKKFLARVRHLFQPRTVEEIVDQVKN